MIADIEQARQLAINEQRLARRYAGNSLIISLVHTVLCLFFMYGGYFAAGTGEFLGLFGVLWLVNLLYFWLVASGATASRRDPVLSIPMALWLTTGFLVTAWYVDVFRISVMMMFFGVMLLASFRQRFIVLAFLSLYAGLGYLVVLWLVFSDRGMQLQHSVEVLQWFIFSVVTVGFVMTGTVINRLRNRLSEKNVELAQALEQVREMAIRDELTGLFNRRHVMEILEQHQALTESGGYTFSICYLDLDHFKPVNDTHGHGVGDLVLKRFADLAHETLRDADYIGRLGGEEFILVLPDTGREEASMVAERLRAALEQTSFTDLADDLAVTVSIGVAEHRPGEELDATMARADGSLYLAKETGRNRVVCEAELEKAEKRAAEA